MPSDAGTVRAERRSVCKTSAVTRTSVTKDHVVWRQQWLPRQHPLHRDGAVEDVRVTLHSERHS